MNFPLHVTASARPRPCNRTTHIDFIVFPGFTALAVTAALEPLQRANQVLGRAQFAWRLLSLDGSPVQSEEGWVLPVDDRPLVQPYPDITVACGGNWSDCDASRAVAGHLRRRWRAGKYVGGFCNGVNMMALAGILSGRRVAVHWEDAPRFLSSWPEIDRFEGAFCIDGRILSCAAPMAAADLMLALIDDWHGASVAQQVMDLCLIRERRNPDDAQTASVAPRLNTRNPKLLTAIAWIERNFIDEDCIEGCIAASGISARQLQRLFRKHVGTTPGKFLAERRLKHARSLLLTTDLSIREISMDSGFPSLACFSQTFRREFGTTPSRFASAKSQTRDQ